MISNYEYTIGIYSECINDPQSALTNLIPEISKKYKLVNVNDFSYFEGIIIANKPLPENFNSICFYYLDDQDIHLSICHPLTEQTEQPTLPHCHDCANAHLWCSLSNNCRG